MELSSCGYCDLEGDIDVNGTANLDVVDIDGAIQLMQPYSRVQMVLVKM
ncbi:MAG: hypothetical protein CM15mP44_6560 [Candidatus Neomarinimicrobiota bacterium]|nr:MAG: hypothetical protein CM15mP44_6560 [Candidatus Neomarinimicrobiota bacterium]